MAIELYEELVLEDQLPVPLGRVDLLEFLEFLRSHRLEAGHVEIYIFRNPTNRGLQGMGAALAALDDPFEDTHVVTEAGPEEFPLGALAKPVHMEDAGDVLHEAAHLQPMSEVISHVVTAEGKHRHRVTPHLADRSCCSGSHLRAHRGAEVDAVDPVKGLENKRHRRGASASEDHGADLYPLRILPIGIDDGAIARRGCEAAIRMAGEDGFTLCIVLTGGPILPLPVDKMGRGFLGHAFPPDIAVICQGDIGEDGIPLDGVHGHRIALVGGAGGDAEEAGLGIDGTEPAVGSRLDPGNVVADAGDFPTLFLQVLGRDDHGEVGLAAGAREGCGDIGLFTLRIFNAEDEHVLGHPPLVTSHGRGDTKCEAFFPKQGISAVAGAVADDQSLLGEMSDVGILRIAGPRDILFPGDEG